jgi:hypothetical protein
MLFIDREMGGLELAKIKDGIDRKRARNPQLGCTSRHANQVDAFAADEISRWGFDL